MQEKTTEMATETDLIDSKETNQIIRYGTGVEKLPVFIRQKG
jgi:hypothetical protein